MMRTTIDVDAPRTPLIRWGAVIAGAVWGLAAMAVLSSLWLALAFPSGVDFIRDNIEWFLAGSGALALFVAGTVAGALTDNRGPASGWLHGMTAWGALLISTFVFGLPSIFGLFSAGQIRTIDTDALIGQGASDAMWATFLTLVIGAVVAGLGGLLAATPRRSVGTAGAMVPGAERSHDDREGSIRSDDDELGLREPEHRDTASGSDDDRDRVMVRRSADGTYVDQNGRRYLPEPAGTSGRPR